MKSKIITGCLWVLLCPAFAQNDINIWYKDCTNCAYADKDSGKNYNYSASKKFKLRILIITLTGGTSRAELYGTEAGILTWQGGKTREISLFPMLSGPKNSSSKINKL